MSVVVKELWAHTEPTHVIVTVKTRKQLGAPTWYTRCALCTGAPCTQASLWNHSLSSHALQVKNKSANLLHWVSNKANSKQRTEAQGRRLQWLVRSGRMAWLGKLVGKFSVYKLSSEDQGQDLVRPFNKWIVAKPKKKKNPKKQKILCKYVTFYFHKSTKA